MGGMHQGAGWREKQEGNKRGVVIGGDGKRAKRRWMHDEVGGIIAYSVLFAALNGSGGLKV